MSDKTLRRESTECVWDGIWLGYKEAPKWDETSEHVFDIMRRCLSYEPGSVLLETGSGTGRVSIRLAREKNIYAVLLDASVRAIKLSKEIAKNQSVENVGYIVGSLLDLPIRDGVANIVWSSGVIEHFESENQRQALKESCRCLEHGGLLISIVPNKQAVIYNIGRILAMKIGTWPYGYEEPLSPEDFKQIAASPFTVYSTGFLFQLSFIYIPYVSTVVRRLTFGMKIFFRRIYEKLDRELPGYFLVAKWAKK
jgi:ubiquinone/menaquinone biosynthesis C-methylase UbiE